MDTLTQARVLANYICELSDFQIVSRDNYATYNHIGAILTDAVLQSGVNYRYVVYPRVQRILNQYSNIITTNAFWELLEDKGPKEVLKWYHSEKIDRLYRLISLLKDAGIERETELRDWILIEANTEVLLSIKGVGPKTVDYIKSLLAIPSVAVDRHIKSFVTRAGIESKNYNEIRQTVEYSADLLGISRRTLDYSIWSYITNSSYKSSSNQINLFS